MKQIRLVCWFTDSEEFVAKLIISKGFKCQIRKIIDPMMIITGRTDKGICGEKYDIFGKEEEINRLKEFLEASDFDVEVIEKG